MPTYSMYKSYYERLKTDLFVNFGRFPDPKHFKNIYYCTIYPNNTLGRLDIHTFTVKNLSKRYAWDVVFRILLTNK